MASKKIATKKVESAKGSAKEPAKPATKKAAKVAKVVKKTSAPKPSLDVVARAAYLNYRRRVEQGLPGDSHGDWLEAERQMGQLS